MMKFDSAIIIRNEKNRQAIDASEVIRRKIERAGLKVVQLEFSNSKTIAFVLGGDGTVLRASKNLSDHEASVVGINFGHLGFLSPYEFSEVDDVMNAILKGEYVVMKRNFLEISQDAQKKFAFNDFVIQRDVRSHMMEVSVEIDDMEMGRVLCDGMIFSTSTGSTAYNLSAGGSVIDPLAEVVSIVPIMAHAFSPWPVVVASPRKICVRVYPRNEERYFSVIDGEKFEEYNESQAFMIKNSKKNLRFLCTKDRNFFELVHKKLGWGLHNGCGGNFS